MGKLKLGLRIKKIRLEKGMTMEELGELLNTSKSSVSMWEKGRSLPNKERLKAIADLGNMTVEELLQDDEVDKLKYELEQSQNREQELYVEIYDLHNRIAALEKENEELKQELKYSGKTTFQKLAK